MRGVVARPGPLDGVRRDLAATLDAEALQRLPRGYFRVGDVLLLELPLPGPEAEIAEAYARRLRMRSVLGREGGVEGEFREPRTRLLWGDADTTTTHVEVGVKYRIDPARVMWSPGNLAERQRLAAWRLAGETVVDLFAGIGYLTLSLAVHAQASRVVAIEKSPTTFAFLKENLALNGVSERVDARLGDCRDVAPKGVADRVLLGLLPDSLEFLPTALAALKPPGGRLHVHRVVPAADIAGAWEEVAARIRAVGATPRLEGTHVVKSFGPRRDHVVFDVEVRR